jgi:hypothetical protein
LTQRSADVPPAFSKGVTCPDPAKGKKATIDVSLTPLFLIQLLQLGVVDMCPEYVTFDKGESNFVIIIVPLSQTLTLGQNKLLWLDCNFVINFNA